MAITSAIANSGLQCPSLYDSTLNLRFLDPYRLCVVQGSRAVACICLKNLFIPLTQWNEAITILQPGEIRKVELGLIANYGNRREIYEFDLSSLSYGTPELSVNFSATCVLKQINENLTFTTGDNFTAAVANLRAVINANTALRNEIEIINVNETTETIQVRTVNNGYEFGYDVYFGVGSPYTVITSTLIQSAKRYPNGRCKILYVGPLYNEEVVPALASNNKHIKYAFDDDYQENGSSATFRNLGKLYINTSDDDVEETDENLIETIWLKNTHTEALNIQILVAS